MIRSMCCRLQLDLTELLKRGNGLFGSAEQTGSVGVVTINCARLGHVYAGDLDGALARLEELADLARDTLEAKRAIISHHIEGGLFPYTRRYLGTLENHFSTIGVNGINEFVRNFTGDRADVSKPEGIALATRLLDRLRELLVEYQEHSGHMYNLEATPAESATYRFAKTDIARFGDAILHAGTAENPYYTNSSQLPVDHTDDPFEALTLQESLQQKYTGGTVMHLYLGEAAPSAWACKALVRRSLERFRIPYLTITPTFSICPVHGYVSGDHAQCPSCGRTCEVWTRVMGYFRPVSSFNIGKRGEAAERVYFSAGKLLDREPEPAGV